MTVTTSGDRTVVEYAVAAKALHAGAQSGDLHAVIPLPQGSPVAVADGLGHGYEAALAARIAVITLTAQANLPLPDLVKRCHEALTRTRGVAISIALLEWSGYGDTVTWLSIGNVAGLLLRSGGRGRVEREYILTRNGVVGHRLPPLRTATVPLHRGDLLIFATDGVREGFHSEVVLDAPPQETANHIHSRYRKGTDDSLVLVGRWNGRPAEGTV